MCAKCRRPASVCPVCDCPVNGHYVGCQGCNHHGHYHHMKVGNGPAVAEGGFDESLSSFFGREGHENNPYAESG